MKYYVQSEINEKQQLGKVESESEATKSLRKKREEKMEVKKMIKLQKIGNSIQMKEVPESEIVSAVSEKPKVMPKNTMKGDVME